MGWSQVEIAGKSADVFEPQRPVEPGTAVLFLHGHGRVTLSGNSVYTALFEQHGLRAVCPHGQRCWWADRVCAEFDPAVSPVQYLREQVLPWLASAWQIAPPAIGLLGVSMGGQGALKLAYKHPREFPVVAALSPMVDFFRLHGSGIPLDEMYPTPESARQDSAQLHVHPLNWPKHQFIACDPEDVDWYEGAERLALKLSSSGVPFEREFETRAGGHGWGYFNKMAPKVVEFLVERIARERRRVE